MEGGHGGRTYVTQAQIARIFYTCLSAQKQAPVAALITRNADVVPWGTLE